MKSNAAWLLIPVFILIVQLPSGATTQTVDSKVKAVTVFADRALVTRVATVTLTTGEHSLVFNNLPDRIDRASLQVNGTGALELRDVLCRQEHLEEIGDDYVRRLVERKTALEDSVFECDERVKRSRDEKKFVDNITKKLTDTAEKSTAMELDPARWSQMVTFYRKELLNLDTDVRQMDLLRRELRKRIDKIARDIQDLEKRQSKTRTLAEITVFASAGGKAVVELSYQVRGASWSPAYDLRASTAQHKVSVTYNAIISQNTGENWDKVALRLSTANPSVGGAAPELSPWHVTIHQPVAFGSGFPMRSAEQGMQKAARMEAVEMDEMAEVLPAPPTSAPMTVRQAMVTTNATSVEFSIPAATTIAGDNKKHRVTIGTAELKAEFQYTTVPKLAPYAYLTAQLTNTSEYVFLPGETSVYLDQAFVAKAMQKAVAPGEEFSASLGIDQGISVTHKLIKTYIKDRGAFAKRLTRIYEYHLIVKNNKKSTETIVVKDQLPISGHEAITVKLIKPHYEANTKELTINDQKFIEWHRSLKPSEKVQLPFAFSVEYPADMEIDGL